MKHRVIFDNLEDELDYLNANKKRGVSRREKKAMSVGFLSAREESKKKRKIDEFFLGEARSKKEIDDVDEFMNMTPVSVESVYFAKHEATSSGRYEGKYEIENRYSGIKKNYASLSDLMKALSKKFGKGWEIFGGIMEGQTEFSVKMEYEFSGYDEMGLLFGSDRVLRDVIGDDNVEELLQSDDYSFSYVYKLVADIEIGAKIGKSVNLRDVQRRVSRF